MEPITARGANGTLTVYDNKISLTFRGFWKIFSTRKWGTREIFLNQITNIRFKKGLITRGFIRFQTTGGKENRSSRFITYWMDENLIFFKPSQTKLFLEMKEKIEAQMFKKN
jgi:hypothetical protein